MKILEINKNDDKIVVRVENLNDLWALYNVLSPGDKVSAYTSRRVVFREGSSGERKRMRLTLKVESIAFHEFSNRLRIKGTILEGPKEWISYGSYHTFNIELNDKLTILKQHWVESQIKRLKELSVKFQSSFNILIIAVESGLATMQLITNFSQKNLATIKKNIPGKRYEQKWRNKAYADFFGDIQNVIESNLKLTEIKLIIICGPAHVRKQLIKYLKKNTNREYLSKIRSIQASSGTESAILEVLKSKELTKLKHKIKIFEESEKIQKILELFAKDPDLVAIGLEEVAEAAERGAVKFLLVVDKMIRGTSNEQRLKIEEIISNVEHTGGKVHIISSQHPTGRQVIDLGSIIAVLRYKF
ncbi:MAG: mRNA surveillance protein pelota [Promethearchaeia archaeon]